MEDAATTGYEPDQWYVVFHRTCRSRRLERWVPGRFKHVSAAGFVRELGTFLFVDPMLARLAVSAYPQSVANVLLSEWMVPENDVVEMPAIRAETPCVRGVFSCVQVIAHLVGVRSCALRPDGLRSDCLRQGGRLLLPDGTRVGHESGSAEAHGGGAGG